MKVMNAVLIALVLLLAVLAYFQGDGRHLSVPPLLLHGPFGGGIVFYELSILGPRLFVLRITASFLFPLMAGLIAGYLAKSI